MAEQIDVAVADLGLERGLPRGTFVTYEGEHYVIDGEIHHSDRKPNDDGLVDEDPDVVSYRLVPIDE